MEQQREEEEMNQLMSFQNLKQPVVVFDAKNWYQIALMSLEKDDIFQVCDWYTSLVRTLQPKHRLIKPSDLEQLLRLPSELLLFMFEDKLLVGTVQASLFFPAGQPTVQVTNLVVESSKRNRGYGSALLRRLEVLSASRWALTTPLDFVASPSTEIGQKCLLALGYKKSAGGLLLKRKG